MYNQGQSLSEVVAQKILDYIISNSLTTGQKLPNEKSLCQMLNVGRSTLREAVRMLASRNILTVKHGSGIYISQSPGIANDPLGLIFIKDKAKLMLDLVEFRLLIEPRCAALAAQLATDSDIKILEQLCDDVEARINQGLDHHEADAKFHAFIGKLSGNSIIPRLEPIIYQAIGVFIEMTQSALHEQTNQIHRKIVESIATKNSVLASDYMYLHLIQSREYVFSNKT